jgi:hypothetical protein
LPRSLFDLRAAIADTHFIVRSACDRLFGKPMFSLRCRLLDRRQVVPVGELDE